MKKKIHMFAEAHPNDSDEEREDAAFDDSDLSDVKPRFPILPGKDVWNIVHRKDAIDAAFKAKRPSATQKCSKSTTQCSNMHSRKASTKMNS